MERNKPGCWDCKKWHDKGETCRRCLREPYLIYTPACINSHVRNLKDGHYCRFCEMRWYNCLCCHEED